MGTNFYWNKNKINKTKFKDYMEVKKKQDNVFFNNSGYSFDTISDEYFYHIGKRSAAGYFCKECNITSCSAGDSGVHFSDFSHPTTCPVCGKDISKSYTCSFSWYDYNRDMYLMKSLKNSKAKLIIDENGDEFTIKEFLNVEIKPYYIMNFSHELFF